MNKKEIKKILLDKSGDLDFFNFNSNINLNKLKVQNNLNMDEQEIGRNLNRMLKIIKDEVLQINQKVGQRLIQNNQIIIGKIKSVIE